MHIDCHIPVTVRITGEPTPAQLDALRLTIARIVAARLTKAERVLAGRHRDVPVAAEPVRERYDPARVAGLSNQNSIAREDSGRG